jgi:hypothetical protein
VSAATWKAATNTLVAVGEVAQDVLFDLAFIPYPVDHEFEVRNVFVDTEEQLIHRLRAIELIKRTHWSDR